MDRIQISARKERMVCVYCEPHQWERIAHVAELAESSEQLITSYHNFEQQQGSDGSVVVAGNQSHPGSDSQCQASGARQC